MAELNPAAVEAAASGQPVEAAASGPLTEKELGYQVNSRKLLDPADAETTEPSSNSSHSTGEIASGSGSGKEEEESSKPGPVLESFNSANASLRSASENDNKGKTSPRGITDSAKLRGQQSSLQTLGQKLSVGEDGDETATDWHFQTGRRGGRVRTTQKRKRAASGNGF